MTQTSHPSQHSSSRHAQPLVQDSPYEGFAGSAPQNYERYFVPAIASPLAADLIQLAHLQPGERVLDVGCGTGVVTRLAARHVGSNGKITGVDLNAGMLAVARSRTSESPIEWHEAPAEHLPLPDAAYDVVLAQLSLQFFADKAAALRQMHRVLAPGGRLVANVPGPAPAIFVMFEEALRRHMTPEAANFVHMVFSLHDASIIRALLEAAGFERVSVQSEIKSLQLPAPAEFLWQYVASTPLAPAAASLDSDRRASLQRDVVSSWQQFTEGDALVLRLPIVSITARR